MTNKYHTLELREVLPKCEEQGYTEHYCSVCDAVIHISDYVEPTGHPLKDGYEILESPTCSNPGIGHGDCSICGKTNVDGPLIVPHTYKNGVCEICGYKDSETIIIDTKNFTSKEVYQQITSKTVTIDYKNGAEINATAQFEANGLTYCEYMKSNYLKVKYAFKVYDSETKTYNTIKEYYQTLQSTSYDMRIEEDIKINVELEPGTYTLVVSFVDTTTNAFVQMNSLNIELW